MDPFKDRILRVLRYGRSRDFHQLLEEVGFSHNTLRLHLAQLEEQRLVVEQMRPQRGPGRPRFTYSLSKSVAGRAISAFIDPYKGLVILPFDKLQFLCWYKKGGYCEEIRGRCEPQNCPQIIK